MADAPTTRYVIHRKDRLGRFVALAGRSTLAAPARFRVGRSRFAFYAAPMRKIVGKIQSVDMCTSDELGACYSDGLLRRAIKINVQMWVKIGDRVYAS